MKAFAALYQQLDTTTSSSAKVEFLRRYLGDAAPADAAWAVYFLAGGKPRQLVATRVMRAFAQDASGLPAWLFDESYQAVGDLAETIALLLPPASMPLAGAPMDGLAACVEQQLLPLRGQPPAQLLARLAELLLPLDTCSRLVSIKLITGSFRVGVSRLLVTRALAAVAGVDSKRMAQRLMGYTDVAARPGAEQYLRLVAAADAPDDGASGAAYPFFLAHPLHVDVADFATRLGGPHDWQVEWKWDGVRAQLVKRDGRHWLWSRGEELVTERFPELGEAAARLPDGTVIDGELVVWRDGKVQAFAALQARLGRKQVGAQLLRRSPVVMLAFDLLERHGVDLRPWPQWQRRSELEQVVAGSDCGTLQLSPLLHGDDWAALANLRESSRARGVEGLMLKARNSAYGVGRTRDVGLWWKWKIEPYAVDAVLVYAERGHGRRATLYTDFTFAVWTSADGERRLVPFAKAYSGLTDAEMREVDAVVRKTTVEKFGPVRAVVPTLVFELGFEAIAPSRRHKSGIAVRFPRILRWRRDKSPEAADELASLHALLAAAGASPAASDDGAAADVLP